MTSAEAYLDRARGWSRYLEDLEARRTGSTVDAVRPAIARRLGVSPGSLEGLRKGRVKLVAAHLFDRLRAAVIRELQHEIRGLEHELSTLRTGGTRLDDPEIQEVVALLSAAKAALRPSAS